MIFELLQLISPLSALNFYWINSGKGWSSNFKEFFTGIHSFQTDSCDLSFQESNAWKLLEMMNRSRQGLSCNKSVIFEKLIPGNLSRSLRNDNRFPRKTAFWTIFLFAPPLPPPPQNCKFYFIVVSPSLNFSGSAIILVPTVCVLGGRSGARRRGKPWAYTTRIMWRQVKITRRN